MTRLLTLSARVTILSLSCAFLTSCGITKSKYIDYQSDDEPSGDGGGSPCDAEALALFEANIQPQIDSSCSGSGTCHKDQQTLTLKKDQPQENMQALLGFMGADSQAITKKFKSGRHPAGDLSSQLDQAEKIEPWYTKAKSCE